MPPEIPTGPTPTSGQREHPVRRPRAGAATLSVPPPSAGGTPAAAGERLDGSPLARERVFRATFDRAVVGIAHISLQRRWLRVNQRPCDLLGYDRAELAARTWQEITHPADLPSDRTAVRVAGAGSARCVRYRNSPPRRRDGQGRLAERGRRVPAWPHGAQGGG